MEGEVCTMRSHVHRGSLYSEVQCIMGNGHMGPLPYPVDRKMTDTTENITFPQLRWPVVIK